MILTLALRTCWVAREADSMCCIVISRGGNLAAGGIYPYRFGDCKHWAHQELGRQELVDVERKRVKGTNWAEISCLAMPSQH